jgi:hypothetical protein
VSATQPGLRVHHRAMASRRERLEAAVLGSPELWDGRVRAR